jgi:integrase
MSHKQWKSSSGCSVDVGREQLRLRFRVRDATGGWRQIARPTGLADSPANWEAAETLAQLVGAALRAGKPLEEIDAILGRASDQPAPSPQPATLGPTVSSFFDDWFKTQKPVVRAAQANDYQRHIKRYVVPVIGHVPLNALGPMDVKGLQAELLGRKLSVKFVKNIISGSLRAMINDAIEAKLTMGDVFPQHMKWPRWKPPKADPFTKDEADKIEAYFRTKTFRQSEVKGRYVSRPYPVFYAYVHALFWTGLRPSEASGLQLEDLDVQRGTLEVRRSYHFHEMGEPKTVNAHRQVELLPITVKILHDLFPLHVTPEMPLFPNIEGRPIDPQAFTRHWYDGLRALGIRQRGLYCTKDTFVTTALDVGVNIRWLEQQTGVDYATLKKHYSRWMAREVRSELERFRKLDPALFEGGIARHAA